MCACFFHLRSCEIPHSPWTLTHMYQPLIKKPPIHADANEKQACYQPKKGRPHSSAAFASVGSGSCNLAEIMSCELKLGRINIVGENSCDYTAQTGGCNLDAEFSVANKVKYAHHSATAQPACWLYSNRCWFPPSMLESGCTSCTHLICDFEFLENTGPIFTLLLVPFLVSTTSSWGICDYSFVHTDNGALNFPDIMWESQAREHKCLKPPPPWWEATA